MMKIESKVSQRKRLGAMAVTGAMLFQTVVPAYATVSQLPGLFTTPPDANVMFTLDDSLSMLSDAIPDFFADQVGMPNADGNSNASDALLGVAGQQRARFPGMWGVNSLYLTPTYYQSTNVVARYMRSSSGNRLYYNPNVTYEPWRLPSNDKTFHAPANAEAVNIHQSDPFNTGRTLNLKSRISLTTNLDDKETENFWPATYYVYTGAGTLPEANPNSALSVAGPFAKYEIKPSVGSYPRAATRTDCSGAVGPTGCSYTAELQNFANWLQYYHSRMLMAKGGVAGAFAQQSTNLRVGISSLNSTGTVRQGVAKFENARRTSFYTDLYSIPPSSGGTPLRRAVSTVGEYFKGSAPWVNDSTSTALSNQSTCRKAFHMLSTDGYWNGAAAGNVEAQAAGNDNFVLDVKTPRKGAGLSTDPQYDYSDNLPSQNEPDSLVGRFTINPFVDTQTTAGGTLADVAAYYWRKDLRTDLDNDVFSSDRDPAFWQHVTMYTIGLGISGSGLVTDSNNVKVDLATRAGRDALIRNRTALKWTVPVPDSQTTGDDLIHAAMNGRGDYFMATDPNVLKNSLAAALAEAGNNPGSLASVATESAQVSVDTEVYQATYNPSRWSGRLYSFQQTAAGSVITTPSTAMWEASNKMPSPDDRNIFSWNPTGTGSGSKFTLDAAGGLTNTQLGNLGSTATEQQDVLNYLRGSDAKEAAQNVGSFRDRARYAVGSTKGGVLGDIVNGSPIKGPSAGAGYNRLSTGTPGQSKYLDYRSPTNGLLDNMRNTVFVGANDGMLHAFDRTTGVERFAYVPNSVFSVRPPTTTPPTSPAPANELKLKMLSDPGYSHRFTVDGPPQIADAFFDPDWKTLLLGSTGAGARSVFAMDITNPVVGTGGFGPSKLLWEFSDADNTDGALMGNVISYPHVARMRDGRWVAIFGNGYDSATGQATLFIRDVKTGAEVFKSSVGPVGGNGLSQPNFTVNNQREVTAIYAGDLKGNVWKWDVDSEVPANWKAAFGTTVPLFAGSAQQPITVMPEITFHPNGGTLVSFGTGKLFETEDNALTTPANVNLYAQAIYGIWDKPGETTGVTGTGTLVAQGASALATLGTLSGTTANTIDWGTKRGWYLPLNSGGERVNVTPQQVKNTLLVVSNTPSVDPCKNGGKSRLFALDPISGAAPAFPVFDTNASGGVTKDDAVGYNVKAIAFAVLSLPTLQRKSSAAADAVVPEAAGSRGQTGARLGGVENRASGATDCAQWLLAGGSDTSIAGFDIALCSPNKPRVSWRQLK